MKITKLVADTGNEYPCVAGRDGWKIGDRVAYSHEAVREWKHSRTWRGVVLSCQGDPEDYAGRHSLVVYEPATGNTWYQNPHFLRKLRA